MATASVDTRQQSSWLAARLTTEVCYWSRVLVWQDASFRDFETKFPARDIPNGSDSFSFRPAPSEPPAYLTSVTYREGGRPLSGPLENFLPLDPAHQDGRTVTAPLQQFLASTGTAAFLIAQGDALLYEGYFNGYDRWPELLRELVAAIPAPGASAAPGRG
jgi:hypothetical protein